MTNNEENLASNVAVMAQRLSDHTIQDDLNFGRLSAQLDTLDGKMSLLLLREAKREGEAKGARKSAIAIAAIVSSVISAVALAAPYFVG